MQPKTITHRQRDEVKRLSLFIPENAMLEHISNASGNRVAILDDLTRDEAFTLLKLISVKTNLATQPKRIVKDLNTASTYKKRCTAARRYQGSG